MIMLHLIRESLIQNLPDRFITVIFGEVLQPEVFHTFQRQPFQQPVDEGTPLGLLNVLHGQHLRLDPRLPLSVGLAI